MKFGPLTESGGKTDWYRGGSGRHLSGAGRLIEQHLELEFAPFFDQLLFLTSVFLSRRIIFLGLVAYFVLELQNFRLCLKSSGNDKTSFLGYSW